MKRNLLHIFTIAFLLVNYQFISFSQFPGCPAVTITNPQNLANSNNVIDLDCNTSCVDLVANPFHAGGTTDYIVEPIPHNPPIPYNQSGGTAVSVNTDDRWSPVVNLPFNFCFYGQMYNKCVIGSNGSIKFQSSLAGGFQAWSFSASVPSPALSTVGDIFGVYHDIDPSIGWSSPSIRWFLVGDAPCRILCVVYKDLAHYNTGYCSGKKSTFMMVLYETTNAIDVYVQRKDRCDNWNSGHAVIGIQNPNNASQGIAAPGRNSSPNWSVPESAPEGWRFTPNGAPIYDVNWYVNDQLISTGDTINVCPSATTVYEARATYHKCDSTVVEASDFMTVNPPADAPQVTANVVDPTCTVATGSVTVSATGGAPGYQYSNNNVSYSSTNTFNNLPQGDHTFYVKDQAGCISNILVNLHEPDTVNINVDSKIDPKCFNGATGEVQVSGSGGSGIYKYAIDNGTLQASNIFTGLTAGNHQVETVDNGGCSASTNFTLSQPTEINFVVDYTTPSACNQADGEIYTTVSGGVAPYTYTIDGQPATPDASGDFVGYLGNQQYTVQVTDANGCSKSAIADISMSNMVQADIVSITPVTCFGDSDGEVILNTTGGTGPYSYQIDDTTIVNQSTISGLTGGQHTVMSSDVYGCTVNLTVNIPEPQPLTVSIGQADTVCLGKSITVSATVNGGNGGNQFAWNNGSTSASFTDSPLQTTIYSVAITDQKGCQASSSMEATVLPQPYPEISPEYSEGYPGMEVVFENSSNYANNYRWNFGNGNTEITGTKSSQTQYYNEIGDYTIILVASNGFCQNTDSAHVTVLPVPGPVVTMSNVFSPNNDGVNDEFKFVDLRHVAQIEYWIFNRWGILMFHFKSDDYGYEEVKEENMEYWDGTVNNQKAAEGTYFYKYKFKDLNKKEHEEHGFLHLVR